MTHDTEHTTVAAFVGALGRLERDGEVDELVDLYAPDAVVGNVLRMDAFDGQEGAREFWTHYRDQFSTVESSFRNVADDGRVALLEWSTTGRVHDCDVHYAGVTVLELRDGEIGRSCAYFDPGSIAPSVSAAVGASPTAEETS